MDIKELTHTRLNRTLRRFEALILKYQRFYLSLVTVFAITGYLLTLLFPLLVIIGVYQVIGILTADEAINWIAIGIWSGIVVISSIMSFRYTQYKPVIPQGLMLQAEKIPDLIKMVDEINRHFKYPKIHKVVISPDYEMEIIKIPRWGIPVWSRNTLMIGLPMLLCLSPKQFDCMVARKIGQFSKSENLLTNFLYQLRSTWSQYARSYSRQKSLDGQILYWLFTTFSFIYSAISVYVVRQEEIHADNYALEFHNHEDVREMITADAVYASFIKDNYWPAVKKKLIPNHSMASTASPYGQLITSLSAFVKGNKLNKLVTRVFTAEPAWNSKAPSMTLRLRNITHDSPYLPERSEQSAADQYIGAAQKTIIKLMDKLWLKTTLKALKKESK